MITKKSKGGKGKEETLRNKALKDLKRHNFKFWTTYKLSKVFERDRKTISGILSS